MKENELEALKKKSLYSIELSNEYKDIINTKKISDLINFIKNKIKTSKGGITIIIYEYLNSYFQDLLLTYLHY